MLDRAIAVLPLGAKPIVHSDRGCHYRWPGWIRRMQDAGLRRSMSKKGCSPDNAACEGFFRAFKKRDVLQPFLAGDRNKAVYTDFERLFDLVSREAHQAVSSRLKPNRIQTKIRTDLTVPHPPQGRLRCDFVFCVNFPIDNEV